MCVPESGDLAVRDRVLVHRSSQQRKSSVKGDLPADCGMAGFFFQQSHC